MADEPILPKRMPPTKDMAKRRLWFLAAITVIGIIEVALFVAYSRNAFSGDPRLGLVLILVFLAGGWFVFILGPSWVRRPQELEQSASDSTAAATDPAGEIDYPGSSWLERLNWWQLALGCLGVGLAVEGLAALGPRAPFPIAEGALAALLTWVNVWSWRRLGRSRSKSPEAQMIYRVGVLRFGLILWGLMTVWQSTVAVSPLASQHLVVAFAYAFNLVFRGVVNFSPMIWGGYVWGRTMVALLGPLRK